jgi:hypothetical protein
MWAWVGFAVLVPLALLVLMLHPRARAAFDAAEDRPFQ